jgi:hypothetical protein
MAGMIATYDSGTRLSADQLMNQLMIGGKGKNRERLVGKLIRYTCRGLVLSVLADPAASEHGTAGKAQCQSAVGREKGAL